MCWVQTLKKSLNEKGKILRFECQEESLPVDLLQDLEDFYEEVNDVQVNSSMAQTLFYFHMISLF